MGYRTRYALNDRIKKYTLLIDQTQTSKEIIKKEGKNLDYFENSLNNMHLIVVRDTISTTFNNYIDIIKNEFVIATKKRSFC